MLTVLPIITPPFVIGLAVILLFGRSGAVTQLLARAASTSRPGRWIYGLPGIWLAQMLAFTPIAFLVLIGVVEGVSPSMEEAAQTLRANSWQTFTTVSLPLMRPGLANAFLLGFIESLADFGNPLVLGGSYDVLSTEIFFAIVGAQYDQGRAAVLSIVLLAFTLSAFYAQRRWLGRKSYATVTGKGDSGLPVKLPRAVKALAYGAALPWAALTAGDLPDDHVRRLRPDLRARPQLHAAPLHRRVRDRAERARAGSGAAPPGTRSSPRSPSRRSRRRSPPRSACSPPTCWCASASPARTPSSSAPCCRSRSPAR